MWCFIYRFYLIYTYIYIFYVDGYSYKMFKVEELQDTSNEKESHCKFLSLTIGCDHIVGHILKKQLNIVVLMKLFLIRNLSLSL